MGLEGEVIRSQDLSRVVWMVARNPKGHYLAWNFVKQNWDTLVEKSVLLIFKTCDAIKVPLLFLF